MFSVTLLIAGFATSVDFLMDIRFLQGGLMAMVFGPGMAVLASVFDKKERGRILGYQTASVYVGLTCGPALGGLICEYLGWRWFFFLTGTVAASGLIFMLRVKEEWYGDRGAPFDFKGSLCYMITIPLILYGFSKITDALGIYLFIAGLAALALFIYVERQSQHPILDVSLFIGNRVFTCSNLAAMLHYAATFAISFLVSMYLQVICGLSATVAGGIILLQFFMIITHSKIIPYVLILCRGDVNGAVTTICQTLGYKPCIAFVGFDTLSTRHFHGGWCEDNAFDTGVVQFMI